MSWSAIRRMAMLAALALAAGLMGCSDSEGNPIGTTPGTFARGIDGNWRVVASGPAVSALTPITDGSLLSLDALTPSSESPARLLAVWTTDNGAYIERISITGFGEDGHAVGTGLVTANEGEGGSTPAVGTQYEHQLWVVGGQLYLQTTTVGETAEAVRVLDRVG